MKIILIGTAFLTSILAYSAPKLEQGSFISEQTFMSASEAARRWKQKPFNAMKFRKGDTKERASMAVSLASGKHFIGKKAEEVRSELGNFSGFFWSDYIPAYIIEEGWTEKKNTWQLVFLPNENGKVAEIKIHKNCCSLEMESSRAK